MYRSGLARLILSCLLCLASPAHAISSISIQVGELQSEAGQARNLKLDYKLGADLKLQGQFKTPTASSWSDLNLGCASLISPQAGQWRCEQGKLAADTLKAVFSLTTRTAAPFALDLALQEASFSDLAGLHAGEKVAGNLHLDMRREGEQWRWQGQLDWLSGEVFWQPFYFASGGHKLQAAGTLGAQSLDVAQATLMLKDVGTASLDGRWDFAGHRLQTLNLDAPVLDLAAAYPLLLKPLLDKTTLNNLQVAGKGALRLGYEDAELKSFRLDLTQADIADGNNRFALYKLNAAIPWSRDAANPVSLSYQGGQLLKLPLGPTQLEATIKRYALTAPQLKLAMLDSALTLSDVSAAFLNGAWHWHLRADLAALGMPELTHALGWPRMEGRVAAQIPLVTYAYGKLSTDGAMLFNVFDGNIIVSGLTMQDPLGAAPRLNADLQLRNLDLGELTHTFSFGAIEGKLDGDVHGLELSNWQPVKFDADMRSSPGRYPKKISQRAVENISALGGAGAAAAIQRSFLRFFKEFNYDKIGLSCQLSNDVCLMGGVESTPQGYVIVKGSGVPAITVLGYNHSVGWGELLSRVKRITAGNAKPIVQ